MTISERIFERLTQMHMTQKQFSEETGILQSTISEWKKKKTNPTSEKIMVICKVLDVTPEWLLSGIEKNGSRKSRADWYVVGKKTELGHLINAYNNMGKDRRNRLMGYVEAIASGLFAAVNTYADLTGEEPLTLPRTSAFGSLVSYATNPETNPYQPMHVNFGLVPPLEGRRMRKGERYAAYAARAKQDLAACLARREDLFVGGSERL